MEPKPSYQLAFFASYMELSTLYDTETMSNYGGSSSKPDAFPPQLRHAPAMIAALVACGHLATFDDFEFVGMASGSGDLIFDALCMDSALSL